jgi:hypothetical protein
MRKLLTFLIALAAALALAPASALSPQERVLLLGVGKPAASGGGFTPASLTGLIGWYKADVGVTNTGNNTPATAWADQSGNGNTLATAGSDPKFSQQVSTASPLRPH